jgi:hypothetical protein
VVYVILCPSVGHLFRWEIYLHDSCFSDEFIGCRSNTVIFLYIFLASPLLLICCYLLPPILYSVEYENQ